MIKITNQIRTIIALLLISGVCNLNGQAPKASFALSGDCRIVTPFVTTQVQANRYYVVSKRMSFGDGTVKTLNSNSAKHQYAKDSTYTICLYMTFYDSLTSSTFSDTVCHSIKIDCKSHCINSSIKVVQSVLNCKMYTFEFRLGGNSLGVGNSTYYIDFGNGSDLSGTVVSDSAKPNSNFMLEGIQEYPLEKSYTIKFYTSQFDSIFMTMCYDTVIYILNAKCCVRSSFEAYEDQNNCKKIKCFDNYKSGVKVKYVFGDGSSDTIHSPTHVYSKDSLYTITSYVSFYDSNSAKWCYDTTSIKVLINCKVCKVKALLVLDYDSTKPFKAFLYNYSKGTISKHKWDFGDGTFSNVKAPTHSYTTSGTFRLVYTAYDSIANCSDSAVVILTIDTLGNIRRGGKLFVLQVIDKTQNSSSIAAIEKSNSVKVYPNPASNLLNIESKGNLTSSITITDLRGVLKYKGNVFANSSLQLDVSDWSKGIYILSNKNGQHLKVVIE